jgi:hypothetical protein
MAFPKNTTNTLVDKELDLTKYSKVYGRTNKQWKVIGYSCRKCLSKFSTYGRLEKHPNVCPGAPTPMTRKD